jgi:predicted  nucleic acid-binding Zn-ribbon protein
MELQSIDILISRLDKEIAALPKHIAAIDARLKSHVDQVESDKKVLAAHQKERKDSEREIGILREKIAKYRDQMSSVKNNDQYKALQSEIDFAETGIKGFEDKILEKMVLDEGLDKAVKTAQSKLEAEKKIVEKEKAEAAKRSAEDQATMAGHKAHRLEVVAQISEKSYSEYTRLSRKPPAIGEVRDGACSGCRVRLRPQAMNEVRFNRDIRYCESCHRIQFYVAPEPPPPTA